MHMCVCLGMYKIAGSVTSVKHTPSINNTNRSLINPIPFNILLQIKSVLFSSKRVRLSPFGSIKSGPCLSSVEGHAHRLTWVLPLFLFVYRRKTRVMHRNVCSVKASN